jgi:hypothetical protein
MSHERESFPILEDIETEQGAVVHKINEGDSPLNDAQDTKKNGIIGFSFKDSNGDVVLPSLTPEGAIAVLSDFGTTIRGRGQDVDGDDTTPMILVDLTIPIDKVFKKLSAQGSCFRDSEFEIVLIDDANGAANETILDAFLTGPGQFTTKSGLEIDEFSTTGFTAPVKLQLRAINLNKASKTMGSISCNQNDQL